MGVCASLKQGTKWLWLWPLQGTASGDSPSPKLICPEPLNHRGLRGLAWRGVAMHISKLSAPERVLLYLSSDAAVPVRPSACDAVHLFANCDARHRQSSCAARFQKSFVCVGFRCCHELSGSAFLAAASQHHQQQDGKKVLVLYVLVFGLCFGWALQFAR